MASRLRILHLSDDRPGHYHLAEGVIAAISRLRETEVNTVIVRRRWLVPVRFLRSLAEKGSLAPAALLRIGYGLDAAKLGEVDLVISSGGQTLPANIAAAGALEASNIFIGSLRRVDPERFSLIITSYERHASQPRHLVTIKPSALDPDTLGRPKRVPAFSTANPPKLAGLLIGGDSGLFKYKPGEWEKLLEFTAALSKTWGTRWLVSTSRRTASDVVEMVRSLAKDEAVVEDFIDYEQSGPGTLERIFGRADMILCTEDSSTMISEAAWARLPVVGVSPAHHAFKQEEREYRQLLTRNNLCRFLPIARLNAESLAEALGEIEPSSGNPLDELAKKLKQKLPELFEN